MPEVCDLANFAIMCLQLCLNQAGNERDFSDLKIKQTRLRNRLAIPRLEKMSKVHILCSSHRPSLICHCSRLARASVPSTLRKVLMSHVASVRSTKTIASLSCSSCRAMLMSSRVFMLTAKHIRTPSRMNAGRRSSHQRKHGVR